MLFTQNINVFGDTLERYRSCFSKPQWRHFKTYMNSLLLGEKGEKNIQDIASNSLDRKHQSSLNRFLTRHKWNVRRLNAIRLKETLHGNDNGVLILDDTLIEKSGITMGGVGYLYDYSQRKNVLCHDIVSTMYTNREQSVPLCFDPYIKKEVADKLGIRFKTKIQIALDFLKISLVQMKASVIVFDEWYMCKGLIEFIAGKGFIWVSKTKSNRPILLEENS